MKMTATIILIVVLGLASLSWGESPPVRQVEVVNDSLNVDIQNQPVDTNVANWPDTQNVNIVGSQIPLEVNVVNQSQPIEVTVVNQPGPGQYEYIVLETYNDLPLFQAMLNANALEGYELNFFTSYIELAVYPTRHYVGVMRRPMQ